VAARSSRKLTLPLSGASSRVAVAGSNPTSTTEAGISVESRIPTTVAARGSPPEAMTRTWSPVRRRWSAAVVGSTTTSPGRAGSRPARSFPAKDGSIERPRGARTPTTWPSRPMSCASPVTTPTAAATPSIRAALSTSEAGMGSANSSPVMSEKTSCSPCRAVRTTTSTLRLASAKEASAAAWALSVSTNVPETTPTPSTMATAVSSSLPLWAARLIRV
jgi:hypothetical protein